MVSGQDLDMSEPEGRGAAWTEERGTSDEGRGGGMESGQDLDVGGREGRGAAWTEERGTSDEGRRRSEGGMGRRAGPRRRAGGTAGAAAGPEGARPWPGSG